MDVYTFKGKLCRVCTMCEDELITLQRLLEMGVIMAEELCSISSLMGKFESGGHNEKSSGASIEFED